MAIRYYYFRAEAFDLADVQARMPLGVAVVGPGVTQPSFLVVQTDDAADNQQDLFDAMASFGFTFETATAVPPVFGAIRHFGSQTTQPTTPLPATGDEFYNTTYNRPETFDGVLWNPVDQTFRPVNDDLTIPATLFVDNTIGNDNNDGTTALTAFATLRRAFQYIPSNPRIARTINIAASGVNYAWPALASSNLSYTTLAGPAFTVVEAGLAITSIGASSRANGLTMTVAGAPWAVDQHRGRLVRWTAGTLNGQYGVVYSNTANTISVSQDTRGVYKLPAVGNTFDILEQGATIDFPDGAAPVIESSVQLNIRDLKFAGATRQLFVNDTDRVEFLRCRFDLLNLTAGRGGSIDLRACYLRNVGTAGFQNGMLSSNSEGVIELTDGTTIDGAAAALGNRHIMAQTFGCFRTIGEVVLSQLGTNGVLLRGSDATVRRTSLVTDSEWRFVNGCVGGVIANSGTESVGGGIDLPDLFGAVTATFGVRAARAASVRIGTASSLVSGAGTNKWSADDGVTNVRLAADGTLIVGPGFPYSGLAVDLIEIPFTFATGSPLIITPLRAGDRVLRAEVVVDTTFDGAGAALQLGTGASPGGVMSSAQINVTVADTYQTFNRFQVGATTDIQLTITPGAGATQGSGRVFLEVWRA